MDIRELISTEQESDINSPEWNKAGKVHDWRNHIPEPVKECWERLSVDAKHVAYYMAEQKADQEVWE